MPMFSIAAVDPAGKLIHEMLTAADQSAVIEIVRDRGLTPVKITPAGASSKAGLPVTRAAKKMKAGELAFICGQLGVLLKADLELDRALSVVETMVSRPQAKEELQAMRQSLLEGRSLTDYMSLKPAIYPTFVVGAIRAGESSGGLDMAFEQVGKLIERQLALKRTIVNALVYPSFLIAGSLISIVVLLTVVLPRFEPLFAGAGAELPFATRALMAVSDWSIALAPGLAVAGLAGWILGKAWLRTETNRQRFHRFVLSAPLIGALWLKSQLSRFSLMVASLLRAGVPLLTALNTATLSLNNAALAVTLDQAAARLRDGRALSEALAAHRFLPELFVQLVRVGEESAKLDRSFQEVGEIYERDVAGDVQRLLALITPATTIAVGLVIAAIIAAILSAVLRINDLALT
jgi:general secretion pathway protein F